MAGILQGAECAVQLSRDGQRDRQVQALSKHEAWAGRATSGRFVV
jgi:hypothetical protein